MLGAGENLGTLLQFTITGAFPDYDPGSMRSKGTRSRRKSNAEAATQSAEAFRKRRPFDYAPVVLLGSGSRPGRHGR